MTCCWCDKNISILRALADSKYCCSEHREYAEIRNFHGNELHLKDLRRRHHRYTVDAGVLEVSWLDVNGKMKVTSTRVLNISEDGIAFQLPEPIMPLMVRFRSERCNVEGVGAVKQCRRIGNKYLVGLEFADGLRWRAPEGDVREPIPLCEPVA
jgi:hypothetical protein